MPKLVSSQTEDEREGRRAKDQFDYALRELTANLLRVTRGAGRAYEVPRQMQACLLAFRAYVDATGVGLSNDEISAVLDVSQDLHGRGFTDEDWQWYGGIEQAMRGGLQLAASRLLEQRTQERRGEDEIIDGVSSIERAREARRKAWVAQPKPTRAEIKAQREALAAMMHAGAARAREAKKARAAPPPEPPKPPPPPSPPKAPKPKASGHKAVFAAYKAKRGID